MTARIIMKLLVESVRATTPEVAHISLVHPLRPQLPEWTPGAHVDLRLPDGKIRQYSLCGDPTDRTRYEIAVKRADDGRGGSSWIHRQVLEGSTVHVSAPRNNFPLVQQAQRHVFVAGGIGVTPFVAMTRALASESQDFDLHLCARSAADAPLLDRLREQCGERLHCWFSSEARRFDTAALGAPAEGTHVYACGPERLVSSLTTALAETGWPSEQIHIERFAATLDENFKPEPFEARIASTGQMLHVPADRSLLDVLRENGFSMPSSCEMGVCGSCECGYSDGVVLHRDASLPLSKRQDRMMPCVSRARVSLTLAL